MVRFRPGQDLSKPGYLKRRMLLSPEAFRFLTRNHNRNFYADGAGHTFHGRLVLAMDGSNVLIPSTQENIETYGTSGRKGNKPQAALGLFCVHDVLNRMIVEADVFRSNFDECAAAREQLSHVRDAIGDCPFIVAMDRGYSSAPLFLWLIQQVIPFVARLRSTDFQDERSRTGTKPRLLRQDIYATIYVSNLASNIALEADRKLAAEEAGRTTPRKHPVTVNRSYLIGALKNDMILCLLVDDPGKRDAMPMKLYKDILKHVEPMRPGRSYPRRKWRFASKHPMTHKRLF